jgi:hypothetical protein
MDKTEFKEPTKLETVLPRTLFSKQGYQYDTDRELAYDITRVFGGQDKDVLCAVFLDSDEAQAWIIASCHFGQPVKGYKLATRVQSREQSPEAG